MYVILCAGKWQPSTYISEIVYFCILYILYEYIVWKRSVFIFKFKWKPYLLSYCKSNKTEFVIYKYSPITVVSLNEINTQDNSQFPWLPEKLSWFSASSGGQPRTVFWWRGSFSPGDSQFPPLPTHRNPPINRKKTVFSSHTMSVQEARYSFEKLHALRQSNGWFSQIWLAILINKF